MIKDIGIVKALIATSATILMICVVSFALTNMLKQKKEDKYNFFRYFGIIFICYMLSKFNDNTYELRSIFIMCGYLISIFSLSKDSIKKKILIFLLTFVPNLIINGILNDINRIKLGYTAEEFNTLVNTTEGYKQIMKETWQYYSSFAATGINSIAYAFVMIVILLIKNKKENRGIDIFIITLIITILGVLIRILTYFYLDDIPATIILFFLSFITVYILIYSYNKIKFYKDYKVKEKEIKYLKEKEKLKEDYYKMMQEKEEEIRKINHDIKNDLQVISTLENEEDRKKFINKLKKKTEVNKFTKYSSNEILNIVLNIKENEAKEKNIKLSYKIENNLYFLEDIDLCNLLVNILDNAIESQEKIKDKDIKLSITKKLNYVVIKEENNIEGKANTTKSSKGKNHGYGIKIIKGVVNKYEGNIELVNDKKFKLIITIKEK